MRAARSQGWEEGERLEREGGRSEGEGDDREGERERETSCGLSSVTSIHPRAAIPECCS